MAIRIIEISELSKRYLHLVNQFKQVTKYNFSFHSRISLISYLAQCTPSSTEFKSLLPKNPAVAGNNSRYTCLRALAGPVRRAGRYGIHRGKRVGTSFFRMKLRIFIQPTKILD